MNDQRPILVAGIGNIFLGDDAFGVEVARRLLQRPTDEDVQIVDFGIRGRDLAFAIQDGYDLVILIDAVARGGKPGTLYLIEPDLAADPTPPSSTPAVFDAHSLDPASVLRLVQQIGGSLGRLLIVGCEPAPLDEFAEMSEGLSPAVEAAIEPACDMVERLIAAHLGADLAAAATETPQPPYDLDVQANARPSDISISSERRRAS